jgi:hypothetical protein
MNPTVVDNNSLAGSHTQMETAYPTIYAEIQSNKYAPIIIYLQTNDRPDDILIINRITSKLFRASFVSNTVGYKFQQNLFGYNELIQYLDTFMMLQACDRQACEYIQVDIPGMPAIMIKPTRSDWNDIYKHVARLLENMTRYSDCWPTHTLLKNKHN